MPAPGTGTWATSGDNRHGMATNRLTIPVRVEAQLAGVFRGLALTRHYGAHHPTRGLNVEGWMDFGVEDVFATIPAPGSATRRLCDGNSSDGFLGSCAAPRSYSVARAVM